MRSFYKWMGGILLGLYGLVGYTGKEFGNPRPEKIPPDVRQSPGGYRSFHFWHGGYRGGK